MAISGIAAAAAVVGAGYGVYSGEQAQSARKSALRRQEQTQQKAEAAAAIEKQRAAEAEASASRESVDPLALLSFEQTLAPPATGAPIKRSALKTSGPTLLGDA